MFRRLPSIGKSSVATAVGSTTAATTISITSEELSRRRYPRRRKTSSITAVGIEWSARVVMVLSLVTILCFLGALYGVLFIPIHNDDSMNEKPLQQQSPTNSQGGHQQQQKQQQHHYHRQRLSDAALDMCTRTLWHTIETTTIVLPDEETFIHTGDIDDLWIRDSAAQVHTLMIPIFANGTSLIQVDSKLDRVVRGLIKRVAMYIRHDPYANAFRIDDSYVFNAKQKALGRHDLISTWNYELDSGAYYLRMLYWYWQQATPASVRILQLQRVQDAVSIMVDLWIAEQRHEDDAYPTGPLFDCLNCNRPYRYPELPHQGKGTPTNASAGLIWSGFRPSDDVCELGYLIPANMMVVVVLGYVVEMAKELWHNPTLAQKAQALAADVERGIQEHGIVDHPTYGKIYAYEVDGLGHTVLMDDANVPSLMSIPYLDYPANPIIYSNTRRFILSNDNPYFSEGRYHPVDTAGRAGNSPPNSNQDYHTVSGYGSPHMQKAIPHNIWPMALAIQGLTSNDVEEKIRLVETLVNTSGGTGWMHESFDPNNPSRFTRPWFCWSDSLFAELVLSITDECPHRSHKYKVLEWRDPEKVPGGYFSSA